MFLGISFDNPEVLQNITLVLNTLVLISALLAIELLHGDKPKEKKKQLRLFYPLAIVLMALLAYAVYQQGTA
jgi:hypothetical protein